MDENCFVMLSALQHYVFCPRRCALIYAEQLWSENERTAEGRIMHAAAHSGESRTQDGRRIVTDLQLQCRRLGLTGRSDAVEICVIDGKKQYYPIEYKKGRPLPKCDADAVQLCAQALCLEEMTGTAVPEGALFYGKLKRRKVIAFTAELRRKTEETACAVHRLIETGITPPPREDMHCGDCSLLELCMPSVTAEKNKASNYIRRLCEGI